MDIKPIHSKADYQTALQEVEALMDAKPGSPDADKLDVLATLVVAYEAKHFPIEAPNPIAAIVFRMEQEGLSRAELGKILGSRSRATEVLAGKRPLTLPMIRKLHAALAIPAEVLVQEYPPVRRHT